MKFIEREFIDQEIYLDYNEFERCRFINCRLIYSGGGVPQLVGVRFDNCVITLAEDADRTASFLRSLARSGEPARRWVTSVLLDLSDNQLDIFREVN